MLRTCNLMTAITTAALLGTSSLAYAGDGYSFPSADGMLIAAAAPTFFLPPSEAGTPVLAGTEALSPPAVYGTGMASVPLAQPPVGAMFYAERFGAPARGADPYGYRFLTYALPYSAYANYANDYYRLFAPGYAVGEWTDRVSGFVEMGHGPVAGWTAAAYYLPPAGGPHKDTAPDLTLMPQFQPHPELQNSPAFKPPTT